MDSSLAHSERIQVTYIVHRENVYGQSISHPHLQSEQHICQSTLMQLSPGWKNLGANRVTQVSVTNNY